MCLSFQEETELYICSRIFHIKDTPEFLKMTNEHHVVLDINSFKSMPRALVKVGEAM